MENILQVNCEIIALNVVAYVLVKTVGEFYFLKILFHFQPYLKMSDITRKTCVSSTMFSVTRSSFLFIKPLYWMSLKQEDIYITYR